VDVDVASSPRYAVLHVRGDVDLATAPKLQAALEELDTGAVVVDLTEVTFLDSSGLSALVQARKRLTEGPTGATFRLVVARPSIRRVLEVTGLTQVFTVCETLDEATEGL
jgi:anti-anti-sigma factor